ncbi:MAG: ABC transporter substrate-binding protein [Oscillospiraceae bacterium]|nr:ABC transporter substrate-binding protein [Oscillospiraceae bacterium]
MKKLIATILVMAMGLLMLAACGPVAQESDVSVGAGTGTGGGTGAGASTGAAVDPTVPMFDPDDTPEGEIGLRTLPWDLPEGVQFADHLDMLPLVSPVTSIDPLHPGAGGSVHNIVYTLIYDRLLELADDVVTIKGSLAESWSHVDFTYWTFNLRSGVYFHNGDPFTAQDIVNTIELARVAPASNPFDYWHPVQSWNIIDDHTIEITLNGPSPDWEFVLTMPQAGIFNARAIQENPEQGLWIGTGAFYVADFEPAMDIYFLRNDNWWGLRYRNVPTRSLAVRTVHEGTARTAMLMQGYAHFAGAPLPDDFPLFLDSPDFVTLTPITNEVWYLALNSRDPITSCPYFRRAVAHALNLEDIAFIGTGGYGHAFSDGTTWGPLTAMRNNDLPLREFDPDKARDYLARSVYNGEEINIAAALPNALLAVDLVAENLNAVGINTFINIMDSPSLAAQHNPEVNVGHIAFHVSSWMPVPSFVSTMARSTGAINRSSYSNPYLDDLLDRAASELDPVAREQMYHRIQEVMWEDMPYIPLFFRNRTWVGQRDFGGIRAANIATNYDYRFAFMVIE